jgi:aminopeptidase-like protein
MDIKSNITKFISKYYMLNRAKVCDDITFFTREINRLVDGTILSVFSGEECLNWTIPKKWSVNQAWIKNSKGTNIMDSECHPLQLMAYSNSFQGVLAKKDLLKNVKTDKERPECLIYNHRQQYKFNYYPDWGFSLPYNKILELDDSEQYQVHIDCDFSDGEMLICQKKLIGKSKDTIFFAAHTCHPGMVNDGIAGIAILLDLYREMSGRKSLKYSYNFIFGPEYYAGAAVLEKDADAEFLKSGFFLDMMGNGQEMGFSRSFQGNAYVDFVTEIVMKKTQSTHFSKDYRKLWGNDEIFYDGPDFRIPTIGLGRDRWEHYHTDKDNLENCDLDQLVESFEFLTQVVDVLENDYIPHRKFRGPLYLDRYGISFDSQGDPEGYSNIQKIQILADGTSSISGISRALDIDYFFVFDFFEILFENDLISKESYYAFDE